MIFLKKGVLGKVIAHVHVIEFQKRGLPHAHILMILASEDKPKTPEDFDKLVCAEIPDKNLQPLLFETVNRNMVHGPCGILNSQSPCMIDGKCSKNYHREFISTTSINKYGYPYTEEEIMDIQLLKVIILLITDGLFLIIHTYVKNMIVISMLKYVQVSDQLNIFTNMFTKVMIV